MSSPEFIIKSLEILGAASLSNLSGIAHQITARAGILKTISIFLTPTLLIVLVIVIKKANDEMRKLRNFSFSDFLGLGGMVRERSLKAWSKIQKLLESHDEKMLKQALIEADQLLADLFTALGYKGENFEEKLNLFLPNKISNVKEIKDMHKIAENLAKNESAKITEEGAKMAVKVYEKAFEELGIIDPKE